MCLICSGTWGQDLALHKPYTLSRSPNYIHSAPVSDSTSLTDGIYTTGYFWSQRTTVGWQRMPVTITIDLGDVEPISSVTFNTVRSVIPHVFFPKNIYVFVSNDNKNFYYSGDAADCNDNVPGPYLVKKFSLRVDKAARYVRLSVVPNGIFLFCDEIEVLKGDAVSIQTTQLFPAEDLKKLEDSISSIEFNRKNLQQFVDTLSEKSGQERSKVRSLDDQLRNKNLSLQDLKRLKEQIGINYSERNKAISKLPYFIQKINPWGTIREFNLLNQSPVEALNYKYFVPVNGVQYGSFVITNNSSSSEIFYFKLPSDEGGLISIELFEIPFVPSVENTKVPDPLISFKRSVSIPAGSTRMFLFRVVGKKAGSGIMEISVNCQGKQTSLDIRATVFGTDLLSDKPLNANVWAYFTRPIIQDRKAEADADLVEHHINTIVIPPAVLPTFQTNDYTKFGNYLSNIKNVKNILLFMNYRSVQLRNGYPRGQFLSAEWKSRFISWYQKLTGFIREEGFGNSQILLYPYDEVQSQNDIEDFSNLITWAKKAIPGIQFYATLANDAAVAKILPIIDIAQIQLGYKGLTMLPPHSCQVWVYSGSAPSRALSPYAFYRLMAWQAFENDYSGIGFWNYADEGVEKQLNFVTDALVYPTYSYSVIYDGPGKEIISTRRWEAFSLGIEDYSILEAYAEKYGIQNAKLLAAKVINNSDDLGLADMTREKMIAALIGNR